MHTQIQSWLMKPLIILLTVLLVACGGGSDGPTITGTGKFIDGPVKGLHYRTGSMRGVTNSDGEFSYKKGETITFSYANVDLGSAVAAELMTPWDLVKQDDLDIAELALINMLRLFQSLDSNEDHSDGIQLYDLTDILINVPSINFNQGITAFEQDYNLSLYLTNIAYSIIGVDFINLINAQEAVTNFKQAISNFPEILIPVELSPDTDGDGIADTLDNCAEISNPNQENVDGDSAGDACDAFPNDPNEVVDTDSDGKGNNSDNCQFISNADQVDTDTDGLGDACDDDIDNDGVFESVPDNCPLVVNADQTNSDDDNMGDACDNDDDNDGVADVFPDNCQFISNADQLDTDNDGLGNACDSDDDADGVSDDVDNCPLIANIDQANSDTDPLGNACDTDDDNDGVLDTSDNCPIAANPNQENDDDDVFGNACDADDDNDGVLDDAPDNCRIVPNADQLNLDSDALGDACDNDKDGDGINNELDNCLNDANPDQLDADNDGMGDVCDNDNGVPEAVNDEVSIIANSANAVIDVLANDDFGADGEGSFTITIEPTHGVAVIDDNGTPELSDDTIIYTPTTNYLGADSITYSLTDASGSEASATVTIDVKLQLNTFNVSATNDPKVLRFTWTGEGLSAADHFSLQVDADGVAGSADFVAVNGGSSLAASTTEFDLEIPVHLTDWVNAEYRLDVQANDNSVLDRLDLDLVDEVASIDPIGYFKADVPSGGSYFGFAVALSGDGQTMAVGANQENTAFNKSGAVYVFVKNGLSWLQQGFIKASNAGLTDLFGSTLALSNDGNTLAVGAYNEDQDSVGVNPEATVPERTSKDSGAVYVYVRDNNVWTEQAYIKASNTAQSNNFGFALDVSADGNTLVVGAFGESGVSSGVNGSQIQNAATSDHTGAAYVFTRTGISWTQDFYLKASTPGEGDRFGQVVSISADASTIAVGSVYEDSSSEGTNGIESNNDAGESGAVYVFKKNNLNEWQHNAYIKASNTGPQAWFGSSIDLSIDGSFMVVGSSGEKSDGTGVDGSQVLTSNRYYGAVYLFEFDGSNWSQEHYIKANFMLPGYYFGAGVALSADASKLVVTAPGEESPAIGINGDETSISSNDVGAAYAFELLESGWVQTSYIKSKNTITGLSFGGDYNSSTYSTGSVALSSDGETLAVGASGERNTATGVNGSLGTNVLISAGAVYLY